MKLYFAPHAKLRKKAAHVEEINDEVLTILDDMLQTMYKEEGCGLAAPQVGISKRLVVLDLNAGSDDLPLNPQFLINPEIIWTSSEEVIIAEGCLSVPGIRIEISRPEEVEVRFMCRAGDIHVKKWDGYLARAIQHEIDHLNGKISLDYVPAVKRQFLLKKSIQSRGDKGF